MKLCIRIIALVCIFILEGSTGLCRADMDGMNMAPSSTHDYQAKGVIEKITDDKKTVSIQNEDIPGHMKAMTMDYKVTSPAELSGIKPGDKITFTLTGTDDALSVKNIKKSN